MAKVQKRASSDLPKVNGCSLLHQIGSGSYATVYKARDQKSGEYVAVKCVSTKKLKKTALENLIREIECLKKVDDPHIVRLVDFQWDVSYVYIIMEYCSGGDLSHFIKTRKALQENVARRFLRQLASAICALQQHNIAHLDLKPQNILLASHPGSTTPVLKLADFGFAVYLDESQGFAHLRGSPLYMAPEIVVAKQYDARADLWSVGVILYETLFGRAPFASNSYDALIEKIISHDEIEIPSEPVLSPECRHLLTGLLQRDPSKRISFPEFFTDPYIDLEHLPGEASLSKGCKYAELAVRLDGQREYPAAVHMYCVALDYLIPLVDYNDVSESCRALRLKVADYLCRLEQLKSTLKMAGHDKQSLELSAEVDRLQDEAEARRDSHLLIAMMQAHNAQAMDARGDYEEAYSLYTDSVATLLSILQKMEKGSKRKKLLTEVNGMLKRAEEIKAIISSAAALAPTDATTISMSTPTTSRVSSASSRTSGAEDHHKVDVSAASAASSSSSSIAATADNGASPDSSLDTRAAKSCKASPGSSCVMQ
eukprot:scpid47334/ scgid27012/ Serine/threonine-protein kinase ULK3; Unc-51-like kinase 3